MIRVAGSTIKSASELVELVRLISTSKGLDEALASLAKERAEIDAYAAEVQGKLTSIADERIAAEKAVQAAAAAERKAADAKAVAERAKQEADAAASALSRLKADYNAREKSLNERERTLKVREGEVETRNKVLDGEFAKLKKVADAIGEREAAVAAREAKIKSVFEN